MATSCYTKRPKFIDKFSILTKFLYAVIAAVNYPHMTYYMIYKYISWKIQLTITFTKRAPRCNELAIWGELVNMVISKISYVYIAKAVNIKTTRVNKLPFSCTK